MAGHVIDRPLQTQGRLLVTGNELGRGQGDARSNRIEGSHERREKGRNGPHEAERRAIPTTNARKPSDMHNESQPRERGTPHTTQQTISRLSGGRCANRSQTITGECGSDRGRTAQRHTHENARKATTAALRDRKPTHGTRHAQTQTHDSSTALPRYTRHATAHARGDTTRRRTQTLRTTHPRYSTTPRQSERARLFARAS